MPIATQPTKDEIRAQFPALAAAFIAAYGVFAESMNYSRKYEVFFQEGSKFTRIVTSDGNSRSTLGFVAMVDVSNKQGFFPAGSLLKAAGWKVPALNFARGSIFDIDAAVKNGSIRWTGLA